MDPFKGARFSSVEIKGNLEKNEVPAGNFKLLYDRQISAKHFITDFDLSAKNVDLAAVRFLYTNSLPVYFTEGTVSVTSKTQITDGNLVSKNSLLLKDHNVVPKSGARGMVSMIPLPTICNAVNQVSPFDLEFGVSGTIENPRLEGFNKSLMEVVRPYLGNVVQDVKDKGMKVLGDLLKKATGNEEGE